MAGVLSMLRELLDAMPAAKRAVLEDGAFQALLVLEQKYSAGVHARLERNDSLDVQE